MYTYTYSIFVFYIEFLVAHIETKFPRVVCISLKGEPAWCICCCTE